MSARGSLSARKTSTTTTSIFTIVSLGLLALIFWKNQRLASIEASEALGKDEKNKTKKPL